MRPRDGALRRPYSTNSATNCASLRQPSGSHRCPRAVTAPAHVARDCCAIRRPVHHADGGGRRCRVAEEILAAMVAAADLERAYVNNGGDIALHLGRGDSFDDRPDRSARPAWLFGDDHVSRHDDPVARHRDQRLARPQLLARHRRCGDGSGRRRAAAADAAATMIANAVDLPVIRRLRALPACEIQHDSDLGAPRSDARCRRTCARTRSIAHCAAAAGPREACSGGHVAAAALHLRAQSRMRRARSPSSSAASQTQGLRAACLSL